jgi:hypothetical protein
VLKIPSLLALLVSIFSCAASDSEKQLNIGMESGLLFPVRN